MTDNNKPESSTFSNGEIITIGGISLGIALVGFSLMRYKTSRSNEWLVRTGLGIKDIQIGKKFIQWPFQNIDYICYK